MPIDKNFEEACAIADAIVAEDEEILDQVYTKFGAPIDHEQREYVEQAIFEALDLIRRKHEALFS